VQEEDKHDKQNSKQSTNLQVPMQKFSAPPNVPSFGLEPPLKLGSENKHLEEVKEVVQAPPPPASDKSGLKFNLKKKKTPSVSPPPVASSAADQ
jgi:hypothetical protein